MESRLRIAHILLTPRFAGSERQAVELANEQVERHEVSMVLTERAAQDRPDAWAHRLHPKVTQIRLGPWKPLWGMQVRRALTRWQADVAHAHLSAACKAIQGWRHSALRVATLHIHYKPQQHAGMDALVAIAPWQLADIPPALRAHCAVVPNASAPPSPAPDARARLRAELGLSEADFLVGTLGRAEYSKGWDLLLAAWAELKPVHARLAMVGHGPQWQAWRRMAPDAVAMPGFAINPQDWLSAFDLFVSAARSEPFGLVFLEAMHAGLPVLASATQGAQFLGRDFLPLFKTDSLPALRDALQQALTQRPARRAYSLAEFSPGLQSQRIENFYRSELALRTTR